MTYILLSFIINKKIKNVKPNTKIIEKTTVVINAPKTADALPLIISTLKSRGYEFVKVSELLNLPPEQVSN